MTCKACRLALERRRLWTGSLTAAHALPFEEERRRETREERRGLWIRPKSALGPGSLGVGEEGVQGQ